MRLVNATPSMSLLLSGALLALGACGDDGDPATPATTTGADGSSGDSTPTPPTDASESVDTTMGPPTEDPTTDDGGTTASTDPPTTTNMTATDTGEGGPISFRFNSIELTDPAGGAIGDICNDTAQVNMLLAPALSSDSDDDGFLDMAFVLDFEELDQGDGQMGMMAFANAQCDAPDGMTCGLLPGSELYESMYTVQSEGTCLEPDPANTSPGTGAVGSTTGPCFVTDSLDADVVTGAVTIPLSDARIAARFVGDPAGNLVEGTIEGFLSSADAEATIVSTPIGDRALAELLCAEHLDGGGWWMHLGFTALPTTWNG